MNDCSNADIRDQLPDLLHERLDASARAAVLAHVDGCVDCRDEVELLRSVRGVLVASAPRIDVNYVLGALPKPPAQRAAPVAIPGVTSIASRRRWADWRVAAAVTLLVAGGSSVALLNRDATVASPSAIVAETPASAGSAAAPSTGSPQIAPSTSGQSAAVPDQRVASAETGASGIGMAGQLAELDDQQLRSLLEEIDQLKAVPITDPEPVAITVGAKPITSGTPEEL